MTISAAFLAQLQGAISPHDTLIMKQVLPARGIFDQINAVASAIITIALLVFVVVAVPLAWHFRKTYKKINHLIDRVHGDITPLMHNARTISDNIAYVTAALRVDLDKVNAAIDHANDKVHAAVAVTEQRMNEFNALLAVIQGEAEEIFVSTAATVRGVRTGAAAFRDRSGMDFASEELDAADLADEFDEPLESEETGDGYDGESEPAAPAIPAAPRVRSRPRNRRGA